MAKEAWIGASRTPHCGSQAGINRQLGMARSKGSVTTLLDIDQAVDGEAVEVWAGARSA